MSFWYEPKREDLEVRDDELHVYLGSDESGSIYATLKVADVEAAIAEGKPGAVVLTLPTVRGSGKTKGAWGKVAETLEERGAVPKPNQFDELTTAEIAALEEYELAGYAAQGYSMEFLREEWERCKGIVNACK